MSALGELANQRTLPLDDDQSCAIAHLWSS
jgi:hypothetical protein